MRRVTLFIVGVFVGALAAPPAASADSIRIQQWHLTFLNVAFAHQITHGEGVLVGLTDTGVDVQHPDLNGIVNDGIEFGQSGNGRLDSDGHGSAMAGLIAGHGHGSGGESGVLGLAPKARLLSARTVRSGFGGAPRDLGLGITWATEHGAKVICIAAGTSPDPTVESSIAAAIKADVVVVAAVGNAPNTKEVAYPARLPGVLAVGGVDRQGNHAAVSVIGKEVAIVAPAVDVVSADAFGGYQQGTGTSEATAIVAGAAALVRAKYPSLTAPEVVRRLTETATDKGPPGRDPQYGFGVLDLVKALTADVAPPSSAVPSALQSSPAGKKSNKAPVSVIVGTIALAMVVVGVLVAIRASRRRSA